MATENRADIVLEQWIELPDDGTAYSTPARVEVHQDSQYLGRDQQNRPQWQYTVRLTGDWQATAGVTAASFLYKDLDGQEQTTQGVRTDEGDWAITMSNMGAKFDLTTSVQHESDMFELSDSIQSHRPIVDGVFLETQTTSKWGKDYRWTARVGGSHWYHSIDQVAWEYDSLLEWLPVLGSEERREAIVQPRPWQSVFSVADGTLQHRGTIRRTAHHASEIRARLYYVDGKMEVVDRSITPQVGDWSGPPVDRVQVRALETFRGVDDGFACFNLDFWLDAPKEELEQIDHLLLREATLPWERASRLDPDQHASLNFDRPGNLVLRIVGKDGSVEERRIPFTGQAKRMRGLELARSGSAILLRGPVNDLDRVESVKFTVRDGEGDPVVSEHKSYMYAQGDFATWFPSPNEGRKYSKPVLCPEGSWRSRPSNRRAGILLGLVPRQALLAHQPPCPGRGIQGTIGCHLRRTGSPESPGLAGL